MRPTENRKTNLDAADANLLAAMSAERRAAVRALIASGEASSAQHAIFMHATRLIQLPD